MLADLFINLLRRSTSSRQAGRQAGRQEGRQPAAFSREKTPQMIKRQKGVWPLFQKPIRGLIPEKNLFWHNANLLSNQMWVGGPNFVQLGHYVLFLKGKNNY
jgi:hypothetical protein